uniref:Putative conserved plasma membrane protein n=1 Tax=Ornithodoros turicata TaxID=34597 RepID=A0A2R5L678_9ACAR
MEKSLAAFRARLKENASTTSSSVGDYEESSGKDPTKETKGNLKEELRRSLLSGLRASPVSPVVFTDEPLVNENCCRWTVWDVAILVTKFTLWFLLMTLAVHVEFGAVFFILSLFYVIFTNLRTSPRKKGELSAYSVFNPNFETIHGTVSPQQLEQQLAYGAM